MATLFFLLIVGLPVLLLSSLVAALIAWRALVRGGCNYAWTGLGLSILVFVVVLCVGYWFMCHFDEL